MPFVEELVRQIVYNKLFIGKECPNYKTPKLSQNYHILGFGTLKTGIVQDDKFG